MSDVHVQISAATMTELQGSIDNATVAAACGLLTELVTDRVYAPCGTCGEVVGPDSLPERFLVMTRTDGARPPLVFGQCQRCVAALTPEASADVLTARIKSARTGQ
jgi:hypothetical protein